MEELRAVAPVDGGGPRNIREAHDELMGEFLALGEVERLSALRDWKRWEAAGGRLGTILEKLRDPAQGIKAVTDDEFAECHLIEFRLSASRSPGSATKALGALGRLRERSWRAEWEWERNRNDQLDRRVRELEKALEGEKRRFSAELAGEKRRVEDETRRVVTAQVKKEEEMKARVKAAVDRLVPSRGGQPNP